ncbi:MAG: hypothetical protein IT185_06695 [Acidobacteria bacterium]|nr:hypothetical protein [Acidobacteriota bacterium]
MLIMTNPPESPRVDTDLTGLFHTLNNHLGIILANAELLEHRLVEEQHRARAGQVVASVLDAIQATNQIRQLAATLDQVKSSNH